MSQKTIRRVGPKPYAYAFAWSVSSATSWTYDRHVGQAELALVAVGGLDEWLVAERLRRVVEVRRDEGEERGDCDEDGGSRQPPVVAEATGQAHHDDEREAEGHELRPEEDPVLEEPGDVVRRR